MKILKYTILTVVIGALFSINACDKENLDLKPHAPSEQGYFEEASSFERGVYSAYAKLCDFYSYNNNNPLHPLWLLPADDITSTGDWSYEIFEGISASNNRISDFFEYLYQVVNRSNLVIQKANENMDMFSGEDVTTVNQTKGEALFLRAFSHFTLWQYLGKNIPVWTERKVLSKDVTVGDLRIPSAGSNNAVLDTCISDLKKARELLPESWPEDMQGRVTNDAANGLLGKVYMFRACYNEGNTSDYESAIQAFNQIDNHSLVDNYADNFDIMAENNKESLFEYQASNASSNENIWLSNDFDIAIGRMSASYQYFDNTWNYDAWVPGILLPSEKLISAFDTTGQGDPRFNEVVEADTNAPFNGWKVVKYVKRDRNAGDFKSFASTNNYRILRMGDVLLLEAEARLQTGNSGEALSLVNKIRERARNSVPDTVSASPDPTDLGSVDMQDIMNERFRELAAEGHRWPDLKRWDAAGYINLEEWTASDFSTKFEESFNFTYPKNLLYPIPTSELDQNPNVNQNPGY
jgi:hypothetical protein